MSEQGSQSVPAPLMRRFTGTRLWSWGAAVLSLLVCVLLAWMHLDNRHHLQLALSSHDLIGQARVDLSRGFVELTSTEPTGSHSREREGQAMVLQALEALSQAADSPDLPAADGSSDLSDSIQSLSKTLNKLPDLKKTNPLAANVELRIAFNEVQREADKLETSVRQGLISLSESLDVRFSLTLGLAVILLSAICVIVYVVGQNRDRMEAESRRERERFVLAVDATEDGIWDWNPVSGKVAFTGAYWRMLGYQSGTKEDGTVEDWERDIHPDDREATLRAIGDVVSKTGSDSFSVEFRQKTATDGWKWILGRGKVVQRDGSGRAIRVVGTHVDITERRLADSERQRTAAELSTIFEVASVGMVQVDPADGRILRFNERFRSITGYSEAELKGVCFPSLTHPDDREADWKVFSKAARGETPDYRNVKRYVRADGTHVWVRLNAAFVRDSSGKPVRTVAVCEDITREKEAEAEAARLNSQLVQAQKMEAVGRLAGGVAHDFNNVVAVIMGNTEVALDKIGDEGSAKFELEEVLEASKRAAALTKQLLAFARKQAAVPRILDINETVGDMLKILRRMVGEDITLAWLPGTGVWPVKIDPTQVDQILANLCVNARDAISDVGRVTIETANASFDKDYCTEHLGYTEGEYVMIAVSDNGIGMDRETMSRIFEPFFTTKEAGKGTGLGLATVYGIVRQNGGFVNVYSEPGQGTVFRIYLPMCNQEHDADAGETRSLPQRAARETILVVEDDPSVLSLAQRVLTAEGFTVLVAASPHDAVSIITRLPDTVHLLLTDVIMPGMNGKELFQKISEISPQTKCLYMSGYTANVIAHHGVLDENVRFIEKPFGKVDLIRKVNEVLDEPGRT